MFKDIFKLYKTKSSTPDFSKVLDFDKISEEDEHVKEKEIITTNEELVLGLKPVAKWKCYELKNHVGLIFIKNPFTSKGQRYWLARCIQDYPKTPSVVNLSPKYFEASEIQDWWKSLHNCKNEDHRRKLKNAMRWSTLGYHHDWNTKIYSERKKNEFPVDLASLSLYFAEVLKFGQYSAEAAIVNYYPIGTTLAGHTDHSESNLEAPLFSFSFGQTAIFLIGGPTKEEKPTALFLKSGDVVIMSKESRLCYHAVPRVMKCDLEPWSVIQEKDLEVNNSDLNDFDLPSHKKIRLSNEIKDLSMDINLWKQCSEQEFWYPFGLYLKDSRVNINVRQVLKEGQDTLS